MKKYTVVLCALTLAGGMTSALFADTYGNTPGAASDSSQPNPATSMNAPAKPAIPALTGTVQKVDSTNNSLKVKDNSGSVQTIKVDATTQITKDGNVVQLSELHKGDVVVINNAKSSM